MTSVRFLVLLFLAASLPSATCKDHDQSHETLVRHVVTHKHSASEGGSATHMHSMTDSHKVVAHAHADSTAQVKATSSLSSTVHAVESVKSESQASTQEISAAGVKTNAKHKSAPTTADAHDKHDKHEDAQQVHVHIGANGETTNLEEEEAIHHALLQREAAASESSGLDAATVGKGSRRRAEGGGSSSMGMGAAAMAPPMPMPMAPMPPAQSSSCFPPTATVEVWDMQSGASVTLTMEELEVGDVVSAVDEDGRQTWSAVQFFLHKDTAPTEYVHLTFGVDGSAFISPSHMLWLANGMVAAGDVKAGDVVYVTDSAGERPVSRVVASSTTVTLPGRYHPVTAHETIVVDKLVASTHSSRTVPSGSHRNAYRFTRAALQCVFRIMPLSVSQWWSGSVVPMLVPVVDGIMA